MTIKHLARGLWNHRVTGEVRDLMGGPIRVPEAWGPGGRVARWMVSAVDGRAAPEADPVSESRVMSSMPSEPEAFAELVASMLRRMLPGEPVELSGPREIIVSGRRLDLENLFRLVNHDTERGREIVEHYLEQLFSAEASSAATMNFDFVKTRVMPRIQPETIFQHLNREQVAHVPFVNGTVIVFVIDLPQMTVSITTEQMVRWGTSPEDLERIARENLDASSSELQLQVVTSKEGGKAIIVAEHDGYDAARLLLSGLYRRLAPRLGGDFLVATPARDMFVALSPAPNPFVKRLAERVADDYRRLPYPITSEFFYVTRDGVAPGGPLAA
ncbi:MAG: DUF1444 family protein [Phycisphaerae bacterium]|nr:DUF1444 family protein [Phycisphaerae bacterium]